MSEEKKDLRSLTFPAPKGIREFETITIREVDGDDEIKAAMLADEHKKQRGGEWSPLIELIRMSVVEINGKKVSYFDAFDSWRSKARNAVTRFYNELNGLDEEDLKACVAKATGATTPTKTSTTQTKVEDNTAAPNDG